MKITFLGGDVRYQYAAKYLSGSGYTAKYYGQNDDFDDFSALARELLCSQAVVLPLPYTKDGLNLYAPLSNKNLQVEAILSEIPENAQIFCGKKDLQLEKFGKNIIDYSQREDFAILNAGLTAEAAVEIALCQLDISLREAKTAILGYGRIGKALAKLLHGFGTNFTVYARRPEIFAMLKTNSYAYSDISQLLGLERYDLIVNTVPKLILDRAKLQCTKRDVLIIELASAPGGVLPEEAEKTDRRLIVARGLPGKCSPVSAGEIIAECIKADLHP